MNRPGSKALVYSALAAATVGSMVVASPGCRRSGHVDRPAPQVSAHQMHAPTVGSKEVEANGQQVRPARNRLSC